jgi:hypothetical protein
MQAEITLVGAAAQMSRASAWTDLHAAVPQRGARTLRPAEQSCRRRVRARHARREVSDEYVRQTVLFATVLFLVAIARRFTSHRVRLALAAIAGVLMLVAVVGAVGQPRL